MVTAASARATAAAAAAVAADVKEKSCQLATNKILQAMII
jgi:hypothetical protein